LSNRVVYRIWKLIEWQVKYIQFDFNPDLLSW
jgi:hypothetical protein